MAYGPASSAAEGWQSVGTAALGSTSLAFDPAVDLLWSGDGHGTVSSWFPDSLSRYTSCKAHKPQYGPVRQLLTDEKGIFSLGHDSLHCTSRNGLGAWTYASPNADFTAASFSSARASDLVVADARGKLTIVNASTGSPLKHVRLIVLLTSLVYCYVLTKAHTLSSKGALMPSPSLILPIQLTILCLAQLQV